MQNNELQFIEEVAKYVRKYAPQFNIRVHSPIIAQFCLECGYGTSDKVKKVLEDGTIEWRHNYAGLKWRNNRCAISNDYFEEVTSEQNPDGSYKKIVSKFCKFKSLEDCVIGYFQWTNISNYSNLKGVTDPHQYLVNIKEDKYATSIHYVDKVMAVIDKWGLTKYDVLEEEEKVIKPRVCIDSGHKGRYNRCPNIPEYYESVVMWKLHLLQKKYLEQLGVEVIITRDILDNDLDLQARGRKALGCDLFISDHSNAVGSCMNEGVDYVALYHLTDDKTTDVDDTSKDISELLAPVIASVMGVEDGYRVLSRKSENDRNKDGVLNDNYYGVLHGARLVNVPGIIIEHGFHTHSATVRWLLNDENLDRLARAEAECIASYLLNKVVNLNKPSEEEVKKEESDNTLYRLQIGAFSIKENAEKLKKEVISKGFEAITVKVGNLYKVQVGAFSVRENAEKRLKALRLAGYTNAFIISTTKV